MPKWKSITKPMPHQVECFHKIDEFGGTALIADDMGLGKSFESLLWVVQREQFPCVVICKATLKYNWQQEIRRHFGMTSLVLEGRQVRARLLRRQKFVILNFSILGAWLEALCELNPTTLILDECQGVANRKTDQYKFTYDLRWNCDNFLALSGTPLTNRPAELWPVLNMLRPDKWPSFTLYAARHCDPTFERGRLVYKGATNLHKLHRKLKKYVMIRRLKADVLHSLPSKTREVVPLPITRAAEYRKAEKQFLSWVGMTHGKSAMMKAKRSKSLSKSGYLRRLVIECKMNSIIDWIRNFLEETDEKLVLLGCHTEPINILCQAFPKIHVRVDGTITSHLKRQEAVKNFQTNKRIRLFIGNLIAAGEGLTLTKAQHLAFFELDWVPARHSQGEARVHRLTQEDRTFIYYLIAKGTIEERIAAMLTTKSDVLNSVLDDGTGETMEILDLLADT